MAARHAILVILGILTTTGCGTQGLFEQAANASAQKPQVDQPAEAQAEQGERDNDDEPKSRIVRALLAALDELDEDDEETAFDDESDDFDTAKERREYVERILRDSDDELHRVLEQNPKQAILRANQRQPHVVILPYSAKQPEPASDSDAHGPDDAGESSTDATRPSDDTPQ